MVAPSGRETSELPSISILLPVRNEAGRIETCLASIAAQDYPASRLELLVLDGRSDDGTRDLAYAFGVQGIPFCVLIDGGRPADAFQGALRETEVRRFLQRNSIGVAAKTEPEPEVVRAVVEGLGVGGGHRSMAKGIIPLKAFREVYGRADRAQIRSALYDAFTRAIYRDDG